MALTPKQSRFVAEYLIDGNATQAAIRASYSEKTAAAIGSENLTKPEIAAAIREAEEARSERTQVTADRVLMELAAVAFSDLRDAATWDEDGVSLIASSVLSDDAARALREVTARIETFDGEQGTRTTRHLQVKQHDKLRALELLMRHLGMLKDKLEVEHSGMAEMFERVWQRARDRQGEAEG